MGFISLWGCRENNCVPTTDIALKDLNETNLEYHEFSSDSLYINIPVAITPNGDSINEKFVAITNVEQQHFVAADFKIKNACDEIVHSQHMTFPFTFEEAASLEDGQYNFDFSIVLEDKKLLTGGGILRIIRQ